MHESHCCNPVQVCMGISTFRFFYRPIKPTLWKKACEVPQEHLTITIHHYWIDNRLLFHK